MTKPAQSNVTPKLAEKPRGSWRLRLGSAVLLVALSLLVRTVFAIAPELFFPAYRTFSRNFIRLQAGALSWLPCTAWDILVPLAIIAAVAALVRAIKQHRLALWASTLALVLAALYALFVGGWALNHYAPPLADELGITTHPSSTQGLYDASQFYLQRAAGLAASVPRDAKGQLTRQDFYELAAIAGASYAPLSTDYPIFDGSCAPVKALVVWGTPLLYSSYVGMFFPPTGEAGVPLDVAPAEAPYTMCHEAAHRLAIASEQEANFAAYLACDASADSRFTYAGNLAAFNYCFNALASADRERAALLLKEALAGSDGPGVALVLQDRRATQEHYAAYKSPFEKVGNTVNDGYLKSYGQQEGVRSYGLVVDYLIAWSERKS